MTTKHASTVFKDFLRVLVITCVVSLLGGCISSSITPVDARVIAMTEIDADEESAFARLHTQGVAVATRESRARIAISFFDIELNPRWRAEVGGTNRERASILWIDATDDHVGALFDIDDWYNGVHRVELHRYNIRSGALVDSIVVIPELTAPARNAVSALRIAGDRKGSPLLYQLHYRQNELSDHFDSVGIHLFSVDPDLRSVTNTWAHIPLPRPFVAPAEIDRFGLYGLELESDGRLYGLSLAEPARVVLHRIDPTSGRVDTISIHRPGFDTSTRELSSLIGDIKPVGDDVLVAVMANRVQKRMESDPPVTLMARLNVDTRTVDRVVYTRLDAGEERGTTGIIAAVSGESPITVLSQLESRAAVERWVWLDGIVVAYDEAFAPVLVDRFQDYLGLRGVTNLFLNESQAMVLYKQGKLGINKDEMLTSRIYNTIRGRVEATQQLLKTDMWMLPGGTMALSSGELIVCLTNGSSAYLVRLQPAGAMRIAPVRE